MNNYCDGCNELKHKCWCDEMCQTCEKSAYQCMIDSDDGECPNKKKILINKEDELGGT